MNRNEMIHILQAIKDGKLTAECLKPSKFYIFTERTDNPGVYKMNGKVYNSEEYLLFKANVETNSQSTLLPNDIARLINQSKVFLVTVVIPENMPPFASSDAEVSERIEVEERVYNR